MLIQNDHPHFFLPFVRLLCCVCCLVAWPDARTEAASKKTPPAPIYTGGRPLDPQSARHGLPKTITMPDAVSRALKFNPSLGARESQSRASEEGRKSARGAFGPKLGMSYTAVKQEKKTSPSTVRPPEMGMYSYGVEVSQTVFQGFKLLADYQKAALQADSDQAALRKAELDMTEQVQRYFLNYLREEENVRSARGSLARLRDQLNITNAFYEVGLRPRLDVLQAEVNVSQSENLLVQAENNRDTCLAMLNTLLGLPATAQTGYMGKLIHIPFNLSLEQCLEIAYRQRPDLYIAARAVDMAGKDQRAVQSGYYPQVEAYYNVTNTGNSPNMQRAGDGGSRGTTWEVGARATWNVFQWGTTWYADKQAGFLVTRMRYEEENLKLDVGYDVKSKLLAVREAEKRIALAEKSVEQSAEAFNAALARYREQVGTNFEVLDASSKLTTAEASLTGAKADYLTALAQIYAAMGEFRPDLMNPSLQHPDKQ
ncbi:MAG: TolC family protein [Desulfovibrio sp.]|jgi:outer membrane protein|nr:TolC family protein [Desulfovibrio sp.]